MPQSVAGSQRSIGSRGGSRQSQRSYVDDTLFANNKSKASLGGAAIVS